MQIVNEFNEYVDRKAAEFEKNNPMKADGFREINEDADSSSDSEGSRGRRRKNKQPVFHDLNPVRNNLKFKTMAAYKAIEAGEI